MNRFIILTTQRSGSTYLRLWLNNHPSCRCHSEVFLEGHMEPDSFAFFCSEKRLKDRILQKLYSKRAYTRIQLDRYLRAFFIDGQMPDPIEVYERQAQCSRDDAHYSGYSGLLAVGFKLMYSQLHSFPDCRQELRGLRPKVIHLLRSNLFDVYISHELAKKRNVFHLKETKAFDDSLTIDCGKMIDYIEAIKKQIHEHNEFANDFDSMKVHYESFFGNESDQEKNRILSFLELPKIPFDTPDLKKVNTRSHHEVVRNYVEVSEALRRNGYGVYLKQ